ncbi:hypothetical protein BBJ28_00001804 [Nothophytophthora sp. Chile5]|nr:hypothetical protein BBJ28_00001804 [Nothophytophthora sp. Chile5]
MVLSGAKLSDLWLSTPAVVAVSCAVFVIGYLAAPSERERAVLRLPKPSGYLPILGNTLVVARAQRSGRFHDWILDHCRKWHGKPWCMHVLGKEPTVILSSPEAFEDVQKTQFEAFGKNPAFTETAADVLGQGIFAVSGPLWQHQRKTASHLFSAQMIQQAMEVVVADRCEALVKRLDSVARQAHASDRVVSLKPVLDLFTMDVFAKVGFGVDLHGIETNRNFELLDAFERSFIRALERFQEPRWYWRLLRFLNRGPEKQLAKDMKHINDMVYGVIARSMEEKINGGTGATVDEHARKDLISLFLDKASVDYANGEQTATDPKLMRDFAVSFLAAGRDSTSTTMSWFVLMMNRYPKVLARVRQEINEYLPDLATGKQRAPNMEEIQRLVYLDAAVKETLRLFPVASISGRIATRDVTMYDGTFLKKGTRVYMPHYTMGRMSTIWGSDVEEFKPERWIDAATGKLLVVSPFKFSVFLGGPRVCLGMKFALSEIKITLATLLSQFDFETLKDPFDYTYHSSVSLKIKGGLDVTVTQIEA